MRRTEWLQETRRMRFEEAYGAWSERRLTQEEAAQLLGVCDRTFRRYIDRYEEEGLAGLVDKRLEQVSHHRAPVDEVLALKALYRERYDGWNVQHFHERYRDQHNGQRSYTWVKQRLQEGRLVKPGKRKGRHRRRRERAPLAGMLIHQDGSTHQWVPDQTWDLIVTMDDATSEVYSGFFTEEEGTWSSLQGVRETLECHGLFSSFYSDRGSHYWYTPEAGGRVDKGQLTQFGRAMGQHHDDRGLLTAGARAQRAAVWDPAGSAAQGDGPGGDHDHGGGQPLSQPPLLGGVQPPVQGRGGGAGQCLCTVTGR